MVGTLELGERKGKVGLVALVRCRRRRRMCDQGNGGVTVQEGTGRTE